MLSFSSGCLDLYITNQSPKCFLLSAFCQFDIFSCNNSTPVTNVNASTTNTMDLKMFLNLLRSPLNVNAIICCSYPHTPCHISICDCEYAVCIFCHLPVMCNHNNSLLILRRCQSKHLGNCFCTRRVKISGRLISEYN